MASDAILQSYGQLRSNFQSINSAFGDNHVALNQDSDFAGMHTVLTMQPQTGMSPDPATSATTVALYNKLISGIPELFFRPNSNQTPIQLTYPSINTAPTSLMPLTYPAQQYTFTAGPFIIYGGTISTPSIGTVVTLSPGSTLLYVDLMIKGYRGPGASAIQVVPANIVGTSFTIQYSTLLLTQPGSITNFNVYYFAIGM